MTTKPCSARRGAIVRDGMSSKSIHDNPLFDSGGDVTTDPNVVAITTRCPRWCLDPIDCSPSCIGGSGSERERRREIVNKLLSKEMRNMPIHVTFRSKKLPRGGKRQNWMRATATLGDAALKSKMSPAMPLRAVWTCSNADADTSMTYVDETTTSSSTKTKGRDVKKREVGKDVLEDSYEDCLKRLYGKYIELEVLLPRTATAAAASAAGPPPSVVYRVPIRSGHVNSLGMVSKSRATVTLYPMGRTLAATANASGPSGASSSVVERDEAVHLGLTNVHVPLGPGLVDPGWAKGRKLFWRGRSVGLV